jgi:glutathione S-transferase
MEHRDLYPALVTVLALLVYFWNFMSCGQARGKYRIQAPAVTGAPEYERALRIQQNMLEQLILFIPSLWIFCLTTIAFWPGMLLVGTALGLIFVIGRIIYSLSYAKDPKTRGLGFGLGMLPTMILLIGSLVGVINLIIVER